jgi:hypothetical protein
MQTSNSLSRRGWLGLLPGVALAAEQGTGHGIPAGVKAIIARTLSQDAGSFNTDWFGTMLMKGLLEWARCGVPEGGSFARRWLDFHLKSEGIAPFSGAKARVVRAGGIFISTYAGHFGLSFPCFEMVRQFEDERARAVCLGIADVILHQTKRNDRGMVMHDDLADFTIPDVCYFVVTPLMIASVLDKKYGRVYRDQAVFQLRSFIDVFLMKDTGLARTILTPSGLGKSYWTRASGWLLWGITGVLRHLPAGDPEFRGFVADLNRLASGIARVQDVSGGLHVFLNDRTSPLETTRTAMCAMGLHESVRKGWLPASFQPVAEKAWRFVQDHITPEGQITSAYTAWAVPAEKGVLAMDKVQMPWIPGFILSTAYEMTTGQGA